MKMKNNTSENMYFVYKRLNDMRYLLDGIIEQRSDLGELGWELEQLLRIGGVAATTDPKLPNHYH